MNKIAVIYVSKYGSTKNYAQIIQEALQADIMENKKIDINRLREYDTLIFAGSLMGKSIKGIRTMIKHYDILQDKQIFVLAVGATKKEIIDYDVLKKSNLNEQLAHVPIFYARGQWNYEAMSFVDKKMCMMLKKGLLKKDEKERSEFDKEFLKLFDEKMNWVNIEQVQSLINEVKEKTA